MSFNSFNNEEGGEPRRDNRQRTIYIGDLNENVDEDAIRTACSGFGPIESLNVVRNPNQGKASAFVVFETEDSVS